MIKPELDGILENLSRILAVRRKLSVALTYMINQNLNFTSDNSMRGCMKKNYFSVLIDKNFRTSQKKFKN